MILWQLEMKNPGRQSVSLLEVKYEAHSSIPTISLANAMTSSWELFGNIWETFLRRPIIAAFWEKVGVLLGELPSPRLSFVSQYSWELEATKAAKIGLS